MEMKWDSVTLSDGIVNVDEDDTKAEIRTNIKDTLDTKLPLHGTDDFDVILMIRLLCILPTGSDREAVWQASLHMHNCPKVIVLGSVPGALVSPCSVPGRLNKNEND